METNKCHAMQDEAGLEVFPRLLRNIASRSFSSFESVDCCERSSNFCLSCHEERKRSVSGDEETTVIDLQANIVEKSIHVSSIQYSSAHPSHSVALNMPDSSSSDYQVKEGCRLDNNGISVNEEESSTSLEQSVYSNSSGTEQKEAEVESRPVYVCDFKGKTLFDGNSLTSSSQWRITNGRLRDNRFDPFKTWSGKLERQISSLRGRQQRTEQDDDNFRYGRIQPLRLHRYYDALEGPELEVLKASEVSQLPVDKNWPFLLRFPISSFGICLGVSSQAILWKTLATSSSTRFLHVNMLANLLLWCISVALFITVSFVYLLKFFLYFEAVRREYYHPVRVNFFFAPWISCLFLALGMPPSVLLVCPSFVWYILMLPIFCLELKIYGQWMSGGERRLSKVANPSNHLSIVGNFVGALFGASVGLKEGPIFFFSIGLVHYTVLFVTLYQRLPTNETLPKELHPVFFLFVAAPSVACTAWEKISGSFGYGSKMAYFVTLFLYSSLAVRLNFFRGFRFSLAWWAYTFPMTGASIATISYSTAVQNLLTQSLSVLLSSISTLAVSVLLVTTIFRAFIAQDLFPNDIAIAVTETKHTPGDTKHNCISV